MKTLTAKDIMTSEILAVSAEWTIERLAEFFIENSISGAPVITGEDTLVGVVSLTDIVRFDTLPVKDFAGESRPHSYYMHSFEEAYAPEDIGEYHLEAPSRVKVKDIMTPMIFHVDEDTVLKEIADTMVRGRIHRVFVTKGEKVTGVISALDMLKIIREQ